MNLKKDLVALTPPMGWNSWDCYGAAVKEDAIRGNADYMAMNLKGHGWEYVVCDIQWYEPTADSTEYHSFAFLNIDEYSRVQPAANRFPSSKDGAGFKPLADYVHSLGLKFGIHIMRGIPRQAVHNHGKLKGTTITADQIALPASICKWNTDMYGVNASAEGAQEYYNSIFDLYAQWGVDFIKVDDICNTNAYPSNPYSAEKEIELIRKALDNCGRPMVLSLSPGPAVIEKAWHLSQNANMWRITDDFWDNWPLLQAMFERCEVWNKHVKPGCWPDCDMLPLGHIEVFSKEKQRYTNFSKDEQITLMTLWCMFRSPLIMGGDMRDNDAWTLSLLTNDEVLHLLKGSHGAHQLERDEKHAIWACKDDVDSSDYLALFNLTGKQMSVSINLSKLEIAGTVLAYDLWEHGDVGKFTGVLEAEVNPHGAVLYKLSGI